MQEEREISFDNLPPDIRFPHEFAKLMRVSRGTVYRWRLSKMTPRIVSVGNSHLIERADFRKWLESFKK